MANEQKQSNLPKIVIIKTDVYDPIQEARSLSEQEDKGYRHYFTMPFQFGTGKLHYFRRS
jgi:hypothetical protein